MRTIDRRPPPAGAAGSVHEVGETSGGQPDHHHEIDQFPITSHHPIPSSSLAEGGSPPISSSSSSGEDGPNPPPSEPMETDHLSNINMDFENEPVWDWEQLNWY